MEVLWKKVAVILNRHLRAAINLYNVLHGFQSSRRMVTASLEANIIWWMIDMREEVLYTIFLDLHKVYGALYRERCLEILEGCRVVSRALRLLHT